MSTASRSRYLALPQPVPPQGPGRIPPPGQPGPERTPDTPPDEPAPVPIVDPPPTDPDPEPPRVVIRGRAPRVWPLASPGVRQSRRAP